MKPFKTKLFLAGLFILAIPAFYLIRILRKEKIKKKKQLDCEYAYKRLVKQAKLSIRHLEKLDGKIIGLDTRNKKLLIIDHNKENKQEQCISLSGIETCKIVEEKYEAETLIRKIFLEFKHKWTGEIIRFCFYDNSHDLIINLPSLVRKARSWKNRIDLHKYPGNVYFELDYVL